MNSEKAAWERLITLQKLPPDSLFSPSRAKDGFYTAHLKVELNRLDEQAHAIPDVGKPPRHDTPRVGKPLNPHTPDVGKPPTSAKELIANRKPTEWVVGQFGAKGACVVLAAESGSGKTSLLYQMAAAITAGDRFMGQLPTKQGKVLFIQADESQTNAAGKLALMGLDEVEGLDFRFKGEPGGYETLDLDRLAADVKAGGYLAVFADSITTLLTGGDHTMKSQEFAQPLYDLNHLASELGLLICMTAHLKKPESGSRLTVTANDITGTGIQSAAVSDTWGLWRPKEPQHEEHFVLGCLGKRNCEMGTTWNLQGNAEDFSWQMVSVGGSDVLPQRRQELTAQVLHLLHGGQSDQTYKQIATQLGCNAEHCRRVCTDLFLAGEINRRKVPQGNGRPLWVYGPKGFSYMGGIGKPPEKGFSYMGDGVLNAASQTDSDDAEDPDAPPQGQIQLMVPPCPVAVGSAWDIPADW
jgi:hypothetical protein